MSETHTTDNLDAANGIHIRVTLEAQRARMLAATRKRNPAKLWAASLTPRPSCERSLKDGKPHLLADAGRGNAHALKFAPEVLRAAAGQIERGRKSLFTLLPRVGAKVTEFVN